MDSPHDATAKRIARRYGAEYNRGQGPDIETPKMAIEVETLDTVHEASRQLQGLKKPVYVAGADSAATQSALVHNFSKTNTIGVMDHEGNILKESRRR